MASTQMTTQCGSDRDRVDFIPQILLLNPASTPARHRMFGPNIYPNLGLVTLGTSLQFALQRADMEAKVLYYDGSLLGDEFIRTYIENNAERLSVIGFSACTLNYGSCVALARHAKNCNAKIVNIIGNDHFSALYKEVMERQQGVFDYGFYGNDIVEGFANFVLDMLTGKVADPTAYPGLVFRDPGCSGAIKRCPENPEEFARLPLPDRRLRFRAQGEPADHSHRNSPRLSQVWRTAKRKRHPAQCLRLLCDHPGKQCIDCPRRRARMGDHPERLRAGLQLSLRNRR
jgi:hypothetical protein